MVPAQGATGEPVAWIRMRYWVKARMGEATAGAERAADGCSGAKGNDGRESMGTTRSHVEAHILLKTHSWDGTRTGLYRGRPGSTFGEFGRRGLRSHVEPHRHSPAWSGLPPVGKELDRGAKQKSWKLVSKLPDWIAVNGARRSRQSIALVARTAAMDEPVPALDQAGQESAPGLKASPRYTPRHRRLWSGS